MVMVMVLNSAYTGPLPRYRYRWRVGRLPLFSFGGRLLGYPSPLGRCIDTHTSSGVALHPRTILTGVMADELAEYLDDRTASMESDEQEQRRFFGKVKCAVDNIVDENLLEWEVAHITC